MKKLEEEIRAAFKAKGVTATREDLSKAAAEVSKRYIEKAYNAAWTSRAVFSPKTFKERKDQWIKENL
jgi:hypothetical protein